MKNTMFNSRLTVMAATMISSLFLLTGCEKEAEETTLPEGAMKISTEASQINDGTKTTVNDLLVNWQDGDRVNVNGNELPVAISDGTPYLMNVDNSTAMYAGFPASIMSISGNIATINYPATYEYETAGGVQKLDLPMVAYADAESNELHFVHANSTIEVRVKNSFSSTFTVDSITLISSDIAISGQASINTQNILSSTFPSPTEANKKVTMTFGSGLAVSSGAIKKVQIPVFPDLRNVGTTLTVRIAGRPASTIALNNGKVDAAARFVYINSASVNLTPAKVLPAPCTMSATVLAMKKFYPTFSVSSTKKVYFSKGNLQYIASSNTWQFASTQTEVIGASNSNISDSYSSPIDLFGWGTGINPTNTSTDNSDYSTFNEWGDRILYGSTSWRTMTLTEWEYLLSSRGGNMFAKVIIDGSKRGVIIFPDNYTPSVSFSNINNATSDYTSVSSSEWTNLEAGGCIFLPATGARTGIGMTGSTSTQGNYWTRTDYNTNFSRCVNFYTSYFRFGNSGTNNNRSQGNAVRLVQDAN